jgi:hypothetical protein
MRFSFGGWVTLRIYSHKVIVFNDPLHFLDGFQVAKHVPWYDQKGQGLILAKNKMKKFMTTYPTEQTAPDVLIALATFRERSTGPVATGFSTNRATPGKYLMSFNSMSAPGKSDPRYAGGEPMMIALNG